MSARPFQVGDRVRITMHRIVEPNEIAEGRVSEFERITPTSPITMWVKRDVPGVHEDGSLMHLAAAYVTDDHTAPAFPLTYTIELLEPAPPAIVPAAEWIRSGSLAWDPYGRRWVEAAAPEDDGTEAESLAEVQAPLDPVGALTGEPHSLRGVA